MPWCKPLHYSFLSIWGNPCIKFDDNTEQFVLHIWERMYSTYKDYGLYKGKKLAANLNALLSEINEVYQPLYREASTRSISITHAFREEVSKSVKSIRSVKDYASILNISPNHLIKTVKQVTGKSPKKWIEDMVILEAKILLCQSGLNISEVSQEIGIMDASYFSRLFKKHTGLTPRQYRATNEKSYS